MDRNNVLLNFLERVKDDAVIDSKHISLFISFYGRWLANGCTDPIAVKSSIIMKEAKISSSATYFDKLKFLVDKGYIRYFPSHYARKRSKVGLII